MNILALSEPFASLKALIMMVLFVGVAYWAFRPRKRDRSKDNKHKE